MHLQVGRSGRAIDSVHASLGTGPGQKCTMKGRPWIEASRSGGVMIPCMHMCSYMHVSGGPSPECSYRTYRHGRTWYDSSFIMIMIMIMIMIWSQKRQRTVFFWMILYQTLLQSAVFLSERSFPPRLHLHLHLYVCFDFRNNKNEQSSFE